MGAIRAVVVATVVAAAVGGCAGAGETTASRPSPTPTATASLSKDGWPDGDWPFTVAAGVLKCYTEDSMVTITADGAEYGYNQTAIRFGHYPDIAQIMPPPKTGVVTIDGNDQPVPVAGSHLAGVDALIRSVCHLP